MITITYWELNPDFDPSELADVAQKLISKGVYPPKGEKTIAQYISTGDYWGVTISEVENEEVAATSANMWRIAKPGFFFQGFQGNNCDEARRYSAYYS